MVSSGFHGPNGTKSLGESRGREAPDRFLSRHGLPAPPRRLIASPHSNFSRGRAHEAR